MNSAANTLTIDAFTTISSSSATQSGGVAYLTGSGTQTVNLNGGRITTASATTGGVFYMNGLATNAVNMISGAYISDVTTTSHGALLYMNGITHTLTLNTMTAERVYSTNGEGGLLYSSFNTQSLTGTITNAQLLGVNAKTLGSMISLRKGPTTPTLSLTIGGSSIFRCNVNNLVTNQATVESDITSGVSTSTNTRRGVAFFFEGVVADTAVSYSVTSSSSTYENCYTGGDGAVFYLPTGLRMRDTGSIFR